MIQQGQNILDITAQNFGSLDYVFDIARRNGLAFDAVLSTGALAVPEPSKAQTTREKRNVDAVKNGKLTFANE